MAAVLTGTPAPITWAVGANPVGQSISIPADCTAVYMLWTFWTGTAGAGLASVTLAGSAPSQTFELPINAGADQTATGVAAWYNPPTGSQTLDPAWDAAPSEGPTCVVVFVKDGDTTAWRDAKADQDISSNAVSVTLTTVAGDLVLKFDQRFSATAPALSTGWANGQTHTNVSESARLSYISATGTTQVCDSEGENFSTVVAIAIPAASGGGGGDVTAALTGQSSTGSAGTVRAANSKALTGQSATSAQGSVTPTTSKALTGQALTGAVGAVTPALAIALTGQAATFAQGNVSAGNGVIAALTGQSFTASAGSLAKALSKALSGQAVTSAQGSVTAVSGVTVALTGQSAAFALGALGVSASVALSGLLGTMGAGTLTANVPVDTPRRRQALVRRVDRTSLVARVDRSTTVLRRKRATIH